MCIKGRCVQVDLAEQVLEGGRRIAAANLWVAGKQVARAAFGDMGLGISPYPYALVFPQDEHERLLINRLAELGVEVQRRIELLQLEETSERVLARLRRSDGAMELCEASYLAGCDGARSAVREALKIGFPGGTYTHLFYVADVEAGGTITATVTATNDAFVWATGDVSGAVTATTGNAGRTAAMAPTSTAPPPTVLLMTPSAMRKPTTSATRPSARSMTCRQCAERPGEFRLASPNGVMTPHAP